MKPHAARAVLALPAGGKRMLSLILASASPRRREILTLAGVPFEVCPAADETAPAHLPPATYALALAKSKACAVSSAYSESAVLGADTIVVLDDMILGKPQDAGDAVRMLCALGGRSHKVMTGVWLCTPDGGDGFTDITEVEFYPITEQEAKTYVATGEPMDKAGAYGIQGFGMRFVRGIHGDYYNVMGLPGAKVLRFLKKHGIL